MQKSGACEKGKVVFAALFHDACDDTEGTPVREEQKIVNILLRAAGFVRIVVKAKKGIEPENDMHRKDKGKHEAEEVYPEGYFKTE